MEYYTLFINKAGSKTLTHSYTYGKDDLLSSYDMPSGKTVSYTYDTLNRLQGYEIGTTAPITVDYSYFLSNRNATGASTFRTSKVRYETLGSLVIKYDYDELGNITSISEKQTTDATYKLINSYKYDELNQLVREDDLNQNKTKVYTYDLGGNIISIDEYAYTDQSIEPVNVLNTITYGYDDTNWKDKLTSYNGQAITYDEIGNPLNYNGYTMEWDNGRELSTLSGNGVTASYTYDQNGLRASKTVNGTKTTYEYVGGQLLYEKKGSTELHYFYDTNGSLKGIQTVDSNGTATTYYVVTNIRGDVTQIYDVAGSLQVQYTYDAWGKILSIKDGNGNEITSDTNIGKLNSLRYRSYYYDTETGLYYLQSRYYNPEWGRFVNADNIVAQTGSLLSANIFSCCMNNPINMADPNGEWAISLRDVYVLLEAGAAVVFSPEVLTGVAIITVGGAIYAGGTYLYNKHKISQAINTASKISKIETPTSHPGDFKKLKGNQGYKDKGGNIWKKDQLHKDHWDISNKKGQKIREVDFNGNEIWPNGPKNKNKAPK